jgi:hypothetical protein
MSQIQLDQLQLILYLKSHGPAMEDEVFRAQDMSSERFLSAWQQLRLEGAIEPVHQRVVNDCGLARPVIDSMLVVLDGP